jgi:hypothetical protein
MRAYLRFTTCLLLDEAATEAFLVLAGSLYSQLLILAKWMAHFPQTGRFSSHLNWGQKSRSTVKERRRYLDFSGLAGHAAVGRFFVASLGDWVRMMIHDQAVLCCDMWSD